MRLKPGRTNKEDRLNFIDYWADFVRNNSDKIWSEQQKKLIDSQIKNSRKFKMGKNQYLDIKEELKL